MPQTSATVAVVKKGILEAKEKLSIKFTYDGDEMTHC